MNKEDMRRNGKLRSAEVTVECGVQIAIQRITDLFMTDSGNDPCMYKYMGARLVDEFPIIYHSIMRDWVEDLCKLNGAEFDISTDTLCPVFYKRYDKEHVPRITSPDFAMYTANNIYGHADGYKYRYRDARLKWIPTKLLVVDSEGFIHIKCHGIRYRGLVEDTLNMALIPCEVTARNDKNNLSFEDSLRFVTSEAKMFREHDEWGRDFSEGMMICDQLGEFRERFSKYTKSCVEDMISQFKDIEDEYMSKFIQDTLNGNKSKLAQKYIDDIFPAWDEHLDTSDYPDITDTIISLKSDYYPDNGENIIKNNIL